MRAEFLDHRRDKTKSSRRRDAKQGRLATRAGVGSTCSGQVGRGRQHSRQRHRGAPRQDPHESGGVIMAALRLGQRQKDAQRSGHTERRKPVSCSYRVSPANGDDSEDEHQLGGDDRLHQAQTSYTEGRDLKDETQDHAGDTQEPDWAVQQVLDETQAWPSLGRRRCSGSALGDRGQRSEDAGRECEYHNLKLHRGHPIVTRLA